MAARLSSALLRTQADRRLAALAAEGSEPAFEVLVERYRRPLQAYCRRLLLPAESAEDVVQQAFLSTWQSLRGGTEVREVRAWLYRVTHNSAINALRRSGYDHVELHEALRGTDAPEEDLERRTAVRQALAGLAQLPELQREALLRTAVEGHSHEDVARALGLTDGAVRGLVYRARATLRTAASAVTPLPLVEWAASASTRSAPLAERVADLVAGGGSATAGALLLKGGAAVLATGALAGGAVVAERGDDPARERSAARAAAPAGLGGDPPDGTAAPLALGDARGRGGRSGRGSAGSGGRDGGLLRLTRDDDSDADRSGRRGGPGRGGSGSRGDDDDDDSGPSGNSGPGSRDDGDDDSNSGSGSESSGPGSGGDDDGSDSGSDSSGSGSGGDGSGSGSGTSGSGGGDSSGSGSGGDRDRDSSGPGSGDPEPDPTPIVPEPDGDSSGPGSGDADERSGSDSSGSGDGDR